MGEQDETVGYDEQVDDLNIDEEIEAGVTQEPEATVDFPDPDLDEAEPVVASDEATIPPADAGEVALPLPPQSQSLSRDGGFTPDPVARYDAPPAYQPPPQPEVKFFSLEQLQQAVDTGEITENQKITQLQYQTKEMAKQEALQAFYQQSRDQQITSQLNEFRQLTPGWDQTGSPANVRAAPEYDRLVNQLGLPANDTTKLLALERTFGSAHKIKEARATQARTAGTRDTPQAVGRRGAPPSSRAKKDPLDTISLDEKKLYKGYIDKGVYADWNAVRSEIRSAATQTTNPALRAKHAGLMR